MVVREIPSRVCLGGQHRRWPCGWPARRPTVWMDHQGPPQSSRSAPPRCGRAAPGRAGWRAAGWCVQPCGLPCTLRMIWSASPLWQAPVRRTIIRYRSFPRTPPRYPSAVRLDAAMIWCSRPARRRPLPCAMWAVRVISFRPSPMCYELLGPLMLCVGIASDRSVLRWMAAVLSIWRPDLFLILSAFAGIRVCAASPTRPGGKRAILPPAGLAGPADPQRLFRQPDGGRRGGVEPPLAGAGGGETPPSGPSGDHRRGSATPGIRRRAVSSGVSA